MCGIAGIVHRDAACPVAPAVIEGMCDALKHRGPDDVGLFVRGRVGLGMRRLSIIDLAGGHQPITNEDRSATLVFNGEIYNYAELRHDLIAKGHRFTTAGDSETIIHLYEDLGARCVERLRGMFALAIWDAKARRLFLARDRFGIKPLYYASGPWGLAFASEMKALMAAGLTTRQIDWDALDEFMQLGYITAPATPFQDVWKLEPGHWLSFDERGHVTTHAYWDLPHEPAPAPPEGPCDVLRKIDESVAAHLVSDVPVAMFLSGGLDSSAILASMAVQDAPVHAFTARYADGHPRENDETGLARDLATRYGARLSVVDVDPARAPLEHIVASLDEPHADDSAIPTWFLSEAVGQQYKVALTGIGGDELFGGYRRHLGLVAARWYARLPLPLRRAAAALGAGLTRGNGSSLGVERFRRFLEGGAAASVRPNDLFLGLVGRIADVPRSALYAAEVRPLMQGHLAREDFRRRFLEGGSPTGVNAALYLDIKTFLPDDILALSDRLSMAHSLEVRVPLVDHQLAEYTYPLPGRVKVGHGRLKLLLRQALRSRLPAGHLRAPKRGFVGPTARWLRGALKPVMAEELSEIRQRALGIFDPRAISGLVGEHLGGRRNHENVLWGLVCFSIWHRRYLESASIPAPYRVAPRPAPVVVGAA